MSEEHPQKQPSSDLAISIKKADLLFWFSWVEMTVLGGIASFVLLYVLTLVPGITLPYPFGIYADDAAGVAHFLLLASPLFFISLCQWFLLRRFVAQPGLWLVIGVMCGPLSTFVYLIGAFSLGGIDPSSIFEYPVFWIVSTGVMIAGLLAGGLVGGLQSLLIDRTYLAKRGRVACWICATAIAWGTAFAFGEQMIFALWANSMRMSGIDVWQPLQPEISIPPLIYVASVGAMCLIIGLITGAALIWLGGNQAPMRDRDRQVPTQGRSQPTEQK